MASPKDRNKIREHQLYLADYRVWSQLRRENKIDKIYKIKARKINLISLVSRPLFLLQRLLFKRRLNEVDLSKTPPFFVLGHWRSGTTHLHYALHSDPYFGTLSNYQLLMFNIALLGSTVFKKIISPFIPKKRPQDNVSYNLDLPGEEEQALCTMSYGSGLHSWIFPKNYSYYNKFNIFKDVSLEEKEQWKRDYLYCIQNISYFNHEKPLVLKNPHNTGRVKELLELFPNAKFVFIHRNPYEVYRSTKHLYLKLINTQFLQHISMSEIDDMVFYFFKTGMQKYITDRAYFKPHQCIEVSFEDLENQGITLIKTIYETLGVSSWKEAKPHLEKYFSSVKNYEKNTFKPLSPEIIQRINTEWEFAFKEWGYKMMSPEGVSMSL